MSFRPPIALLCFLALSVEASEPDAGAEIWTLLSINGTVVAETEGTAIPDGGVLLCDPARPPFEAEATLWRHPRADFRSNDGWGPLRWGMTAQELKKSVSGARKAKESTPALTLYTWKAKVDAQPAEAVAFLVEDHLAAVKIITQLEFDHVAGILDAKYGEPFESGVLSASWERPQTDIELYVESLRTTVWYASRVHSHALRAELRNQQAKTEGL